MTLTGSLTADQWLLLLTVYGPIIIPQLCSACTPSDASDQILHQCVAAVKKLEAERTVEATHNADNRKALADAKKHGKDAYEAEKAHIASLKLQEAEVKNQEKLRITTTKQAEKARIAAEKRHKQLCTRHAYHLLHFEVIKLIIFKTTIKCKAMTQTVDDLTKGEICPTPPPPPPPPTASANEGFDNADDSTNAKFCLHPDDPENFLKLSTALHIIV
ncbi:uncharacterized protein EDB91DRAFT_1257863 [Suillus paluster]|uniref:uncharacterized protein n=1 Tax=Suillus paluster TaxID=48578 RepID=UPI001B885967|nr:uncharacterized protein EDB91DRAFT_1257863 [Suillus paluster]KAG1719168.1 hypothetical protein EDB91DRAFT_1257863 [Suillus paluster]